MEIMDLLKRELQGSFDFFYEFTNLEPGSRGYGLTVDTTRKRQRASIASVGFALSMWVIACERGFLSSQAALAITQGTFQTLLNQASHFHGFFAHYLDMQTGKRLGKCEFSTIDTALCLNGVITAAAYFQETAIRQMAEELLGRVDWRFLVFERDGRTLLRMAYNPDRDGDYVSGMPGFISQWDMAAEQKMMYLQAATQLEPLLARQLYQGFSRDIGMFEGQEIIVNPGGNLFAYQFSEAWLDTARYLDPDGIDWFRNTRLAALANRSYCMQLAGRFSTYHANSWGLSCGDSPWGYDVSGSTPCLGKVEPNGTVSIYSALASLPFVPEHVPEMALYLYHHQPDTWGKYGFYDSYNLAVSPPWYSGTLIGIDKGCSALMIENHLTGLIWNVYTNSSWIQKALAVLNFQNRKGMQS